MRVHERSLTAELLEPPPEWRAVPPAQMRAEEPDLHLSMEQGRTLHARCSLWWRHTPLLDGRRTGIIGHFGACDAPAVTALLGTACNRLRTEGCTVAIAPMDGNTWRRYRFVTDAGDTPPFLLEPTNPPGWPAWIAAAGFETLATYRSLMTTDLTTRDPRALERGPALRAAGVRIRALRVDEFDAELRRIYSVARVAFAENFLYTPLAEAEFVEQYRKVQPLVDPALVLLAEGDGRTVGFAFGLPDPHSASSAHRTMIVKTLAILPERERYAGLGRVLTDALHTAAHARGYTRAIHALIHDANHSRAISERTATVIRRYALYARRLDG